ncbi:hypothetical protein CLU79DRAFT_704973 [Phycomyces nitens]|nr:hypothetical protein CLU79DRAFT_704973 [Phycomyces nitens]
MYKRSNLDPTYDEWLQTAHLLDPPFDYFSFADLVSRDNRITNVLYMGILTKNMQTSTKYLDKGVKALRLFESRSRKNSAFCVAYETYWYKRKEDSVVGGMRKRQLEGALSINDAIVSNMEGIIKKSSVTTASTVETKEPRTPSRVKEETKDVLNTIKYVDKR